MIARYYNATLDLNRSAMNVKNVQIAELMAKLWSAHIPVVAISQVVCIMVKNISWMVVNAFLYANMTQITQEHANGMKTARNVFAHASQDINCDREE
jgi:hypothetical protein